MAEFAYLNGGNSEVQDKQAEAYQYAPSGTTGIAATGVIEGLLVTQTATASGSVLISVGACLNQASLGQGADRLINPSQKTLNVFTANPVGGLPRNDVVVFDSITATILAIIGTPNAAPTDPTVPATSVALARLRHAASATTIPTAKIDQLQVPTTLRGTTPDDTGWITPSLASGWFVFNAETIRYRRLNGIVYMRGRGSIATATSAVAFTLPTGFRPGALIVTLLPDSGGTTTRSILPTSGAVSQSAAAIVSGWSFGAFPPFPADL